MSATMPSHMATSAETVLCPRCEAGFECGANSSRCWCAGVMLDDKVRADMAGFYKGCLCPGCLQFIEENRPPRLSVWEFLKKNLRRTPPPDLPS